MKNLVCIYFLFNVFIAHFIWVRSQNCGCLVTYQLIAKPGNKTAAVLWPDPYVWEKLIFSKFNSFSVFKNSMLVDLWYGLLHVDIKAYSINPLCLHMIYLNSEHNILQEFSQCKEAAIHENGLYEKGNSVYRKYSACTVLVQEVIKSRSHFVWIVNTLLIIPWEEWLTFILKTFLLILKTFQERHWKQCPTRSYIIYQHQFR